MKKFIFSIFALAMVTVASAQKQPKISYKVGVVTGLPANVTNTTVGAGSTMVEASTKLSNKLHATLNTGYMRIVRQDEKFSQVPVLVGLRYSINPQWYFGGSVGTTIPTKSTYGDTEFGYSPYLGYQKGHISVDARYYLSGINTPTNTVCLVFSYIL